MFVCKRCNYTTNNKSNLKKHLMAKFRCICHDEHISKEELLEELYPKKDKQYKCPCGKAYVYQRGLASHQKTCIHEKNLKDEKMLNLVDILEEKLRKEMKEKLEEAKEEFKQEMKKTDSKIISNSNSNNINNSNNTKILNKNITTNNITTNIIINDFGSENIKYINKQLIEKCLSLENKGLTLLLKDLHFSKDHPENNNIKVTNLKSPHIQTMQDGQWQQEKKDDILKALLIKEILILRGYHLIDDEDYVNESDEEEENEWLDKLENEDPKLLKDANIRNFLALNNHTRNFLKN